MTPVPDDPLLEGGYGVFYDREAPVEIRVAGSSSSEPGTMERVRFKVAIATESGVNDFVVGATEIKEVRAVRVELTTETDLFFQVRFEVNMDSYFRIQEAQSLTVDLCGFVTSIVTALNSCIKDPNAFFAVLTLAAGTSGGKLEFVQNVGHKYLQLMTLDVASVSSEEVRRTIAHRYGVIKQKLRQIQVKFTDLRDLVKLKNPSILLHFHKSPPPLRRGHRSEFLQSNHQPSSPRR
jgi:hypothetical protein